MDDDKLTELLWEHDEKGLAALKAKHGRLILNICRGILKSPQDAEECLNDALLAMWNSIPPDRPENLTAYAAKIARRKAVDRLRYNTAAIRNAELLTELDECIPSSYRAEEKAEKSELSAALNDWLRKQGEKQQRLFVQRYFLMNSVLKSAEKTGMSLTAATTALSRRSLKPRKFSRAYIVIAIAAALTLLMGAVVINRQTLESNNAQVTYNIISQTQARILTYEEILELGGVHKNDNDNPWDYGIFQFDELTPSELLSEFNLPVLGNENFTELKGPEYFFHKDDDITASFYYELLDNETGAKLMIRMKAILDEERITSAGILNWDIDEILELNDGSKAMFSYFPADETASGSEFNNIFFSYEGIKYDMTVYFVDGDTCKEILNRLGIL